MKKFAWLILAGLFSSCSSKDQIQFKNETFEHIIPLDGCNHAIIAYWKKYIGYRKTVDETLGSLTFAQDNPCTMNLWLNRTSADAGMIQEVVGPYTETEITKALIDQAIIHGRVSKCAQLRINVHESQVYRLDTRNGVLKPNEQQPGWHEWMYELS